MKGKLDKENPVFTSNDLEIGHSDYSSAAVRQYRFFLLIIFIILFIAVAYVAFRLLGFYGDSAATMGNGSHENPVFNPPEAPSETPEIPGMKVYDADKDADELEKDAPVRNEQFNIHINEMKNTDQETDQIKMMQQRDKFAAEKLEFLKRIEKAETKEERQALIKELREKIEREQNQDDAEN